MKKNKLKALQESLGEAISPLPKTDRRDTVSSLLENYRSDNQRVNTDIKTDNIIKTDDISSLSATPPHSTIKAETNVIDDYPVSPQRDFTKVANSITKTAIPEKLFKGTSKHTYDALYQRTRGSVSPIRTIKVKKSELAKWVGISNNTLLRHLTHLKTVGLIKIEYELGDNNGSVYEVLVPEEVGTPHPTPPLAPIHI